MFVSFYNKPALEVAVQFEDATGEVFKHQNNGLQ